MREFGQTQSGQYPLVSLGAPADARQDGKRWSASYAPSNGPITPTGDQCLECRDFFWDTAPAFGAWEDFCANKRKDKSIADDVEKGIAVMRGGPKTFHEPEVTTLRKTGVRIKRVYSAANAIEFRNYFKKAPKGPIVKGIPVMEIGPPGKVEKVWLFSFNASLPFRHVEMVEENFEMVSSIDR